MVPYPDPKNSTRIQCKVAAIPLKEKWGETDAVLVPTNVELWKKTGALSACAWLSRPDVEALSAVASRIEFKPKSADVFQFDLSPLTRVCVGAFPAKPSAFDALEIFRLLLDPILALKARTLLLDLRGWSSETVEVLAGAAISALTIREFEPPKVTQEKVPSKRQASAWKLTIWVSGRENVSLAETAAKQGHHVSQGTNLVRSLSLMATNHLTPTSYVEYCRRFAKEWGLKFDFLGISDLRRKGAGAFLAVARGSSDSGAGIVTLRYRPSGSAKATPIAIVGKGVTFDTGGSNLKTGSHMFGMNGDMAGSAVVLALLRLACMENWKTPLTGYLAITDNAISDRSYRPNEVVQSLSGKTIEIVDTDAEGRMILADTLTLASSEAVEWILDFATLTGACVRAVGTTYSGAFTNRSEMFEPLRMAGIQSGERIWPFPNDDDFGRCLKSEVADIKQCRTSGGVDHLEAAHFLRSFVGEKGWIHVDLSSSENEEGLAHVPPKTTGFGVRVGAAILSRLMRGNR